MSAWRRVLVKFKILREPYPDTSESGETYDKEQHYEALRHRFKMFLTVMGIGYAVTSMISTEVLFLTFTFQGLPVQISEPNRLVALGELIWSLVSFSACLVLFYRYWVKNF